VIKIVPAGVAEWVDAQDLKSAPRGFGKPAWDAESPLYFLPYVGSTICIEEDCYGGFCTRYSRKNSHTQTLPLTYCASILPEIGSNEIPYSP